MAAAASPDRRSIAIDLLGALWVLPFHGGEAKRITPELIEARQPTWSPDSQSIAFQGYDDGAWHIYVIPRDGGEAKAITNGLFDDREPVWSHDGSRIAFSSDRYGGITTIWTVVVSSGEVKQLSPRDGWMTWSPNDQEVTFVSADAGTAARGRTHRRDLGGELGRPRAADRHHVKDEGCRRPRRDPAGTTLVYVAGGALRMSRDRNVQLAASSQDVFPFKPQWLGSGEVLYTANGHIWRHGLGMRGSRNGVEATIDGPTGVGVVPFTAKVSLQRSTYAIAHRALEPAGPQKLTGIVSPVISPDGHAIAFTAMGDLWILPSGGQPCRSPTMRPWSSIRHQSPDSTRARLRERSRRTHGSLGSRSARQPDVTADRGARRRLGPRLVARRQPHRLPPRSPDADHDRPSARSTPLRLPAVDAWGIGTSDVVRRRQLDRGRQPLPVLEPLPRRAQPDCGVFRDHERHVVVGDRRRAFGW
jgi:hypothetical protein